jgi:hypothetical protein
MYEMIQATAYCLMYQVEDADLVQVLRGQRRRKPPPKKPSLTTSKIDESSKENHNQATNQIMTNYFERTSKKENSGESQDETPAITVEHERPLSDKSKTPTEQQDENSNNGSSTTCDSKPSSERLQKQEVSSDAVAKEANKIPVATKNDDAEKVETTTTMEIPDDAPCDSKPSSEGLQKQEVSSAEMVEKDTSKTTIATENNNDKEVVETTTTMEIAVNRISLDDPLLQHRYHWKTVIFPRLRSWVDAVYSIRNCDSKRYQLLTTMAQAEQDPKMLKQAWKLLFDECEWLRHCDTSYQRDIAALSP